MDLKAEIEIGVILASYALGCVVPGYYLVRMRTGIDVRAHGSGSVGATNVGRILGPVGFGVTFCGDLCKGMAAVALPRWMSLPEWVLLACTLGVVLGHLFPLQLGFRGGKGIAAGLGALLVLDWRLIVLLLPFALGLLLTKRFVVSGLLAVALLPFVALWVRHSWLDAFALMGLAALILWAHRRNLACGGAPLNEPMSEGGSK